MSNKPELTPPTEPFDPFDPRNLRIDQSFLKQGAVKKLLTTVPVRRPNKQEFFRVHLDEAYRVTVVMIELIEDRDVYLVSPGFTDQLNAGEYHCATIYLCMNRQKVAFLWPVKLPSPDGRQNRWHESAAEGAERGMVDWIRLSANMDLGAYEIALANGSFPEPVWPDLPFRELLRIGFKGGRIIEGPDHPVMQKLRGEI
jgi:hypothetical protein